MVTITPVARTGAALAGACGIVLLAGCAGTADAEPAASREYADGTYTASGAYQTPETREEITVTLTLEDGIVTEVEVTGNPQARETHQFQGEFIGGIADEVVAKPIDELSVYRVAGSSLTSGGFNLAVEAIKEQAAQ